jgi:hypothetical protein
MRMTDDVGYATRPRPALGGLPATGASGRGARCWPTRQLLCSQTTSRFCSAYLARMGTHPPHRTRLRRRPGVRRTPRGGLNQAQKMARPGRATGQPGRRRPAARRENPLRRRRGAGPLRRRADRSDAAPGHGGAGDGLLRVRPVRDDLVAARRHVAHHSPAAAQAGRRSARTDARLVLGVGHHHDPRARRASRDPRRPGVTAHRRRPAVRPARHARVDRPGHRPQPHPPRGAPPTCPRPAHHGGPARRHPCGPVGAPGLGDGSPSRTSATTVHRSRPRMSLSSQAQSNGLTYAD